MKIKYIASAFAVILSTAVCATVQAQTSDTLKKIKDSGVINIGGRDASFPFSYKVSSDSNPIGFTADLCMKVVNAVKQKLGMPGLKV